MRVHTASLLIAASVLASAPSSKSQPDEPLSPVDADAAKLRQLIRVISVYTRQSDGELPPDLGATLDVFEGREGGAVAAVGRHYVSVLQEPPRIDEQSAAPWVNEHSAFTYLGRAGVPIDSVAEWGDTAIAHLRLDTGHAGAATPENPDGIVFPVLFLDGHVEVLSRVDAQRIIEESRRVFQAHATGAPFPADRQALWNAATIVKALRAYADAHEGVLPPNLGAALAHVPADPVRAATPCARARIFLSPSRAETTFIPDVPTPEWVNRNTSYVYLGGGGVLLGRVEDPGRTVLIHARPDEAMRVWRPGQERLVVTIATTSGRAENVDRQYADWVTAESVKVVESARSGSPLPPFQHAQRDLRLLGKAIAAYAAANDDAMPQDLGSLLPYVPDEPYWPLSPVERGAVFLSPRLESLTRPPAEPTADWVNRFANYHYAAAEGLSFADLKKPGTPMLVLLRPPLEEAFPIRLPGGEMLVVPFTDARGQVIPTSREGIEADIARTEAALIRARRPPR